MRKIMIVEDDPAIREELALLLENEGYQALAVTDFGDVPGQAGTFGPDLVLLDLGLPGRDGFSLCAELRRRSPFCLPGSRRCCAAAEVRRSRTSWRLGECGSACPGGPCGQVDGPRSSPGTS